MESERPFIRTAAGAALYAEGGILVERHPDTPIPPLGSPEFRAFVQTPEWIEMRHAEALDYDKAWEDNRQSERRARIPQAFAADFRSRFPIDDPRRIDYEEYIRSKPAAEIATERIESLGKLSEAALLLTKIARP